MLYRIVAEDGTPLDAHFEIDGSIISFPGHGDAKGKLAINAALRLALLRLQAAGHPIRGIWIDSGRTRKLVLHRRMVPSADGKSPARAAAGGSDTRKLRIGLAGTLSEQRIAAALGAIAVKTTTGSGYRLPPEDLARITAEHVWNAVQKLRDGPEVPETGQPGGQDLVMDDGTRLPPRAVLSLAASEALGLEIRPEHLSGALVKRCLRRFRHYGFIIVPTKKSVMAADIPPSPEDNAWTEGRPKLVAHLKRERAGGLSAAKKDAFRRQFGRLFCERCKVDPVEAYGSADAEACIEVHHRSIQVKDMADGHRTRLEDLQCLCANCHRLVHRRLKENGRQQSGPRTRRQTTADGETTAGGGHAPTPP